MRFAIALALVLSACAAPPDAPPLAQVSQGEVVADFSLEDRNPSSLSFGQAISPRAQKGVISAWYFSHAS